jgi:hypothetical protein
LHGLFAVRRLLRYTPWSYDLSWLVAKNLSEPARIIAQGTTTAGSKHDAYQDEVAGVAVSARHVTRLARCRWQLSRAVLGSITGSATVTILRDALVLDHAIPHPRVDLRRHSGRAGIAVTAGLPR